MKATLFCQGCGDPFIGGGLYCEECAPLINKRREVHKQPKFGGQRDPKRDRIKYRVRKEDEYAKVS